MSKEGYKKFIKELVQRIKTHEDYDYHDEPIWIIAEWENSVPK